MSVCLSVCAVFPSHQNRYVYPSTSGSPVLNREMKKASVVVSYKNDDTAAAAAAAAAAAVDAIYTSRLDLSRKEARRKARPKIKKPKAPTLSVCVFFFYTKNNCANRKCRLLLRNTRGLMTGVSIDATFAFFRNMRGWPLSPLFGHSVCCTTGGHRNSAVVSIAFS